MQVNHLHLRVESVERAVAFYGRWFALKPHVWHGDVLFVRDDAGMDLALAPGPKGDIPAWFHFGFRLDDKPDVADLADRMAEAGVRIAEPLNDEGDLVYFRCRDPDGYGIEVYWELQPT